MYIAIVFSVLNGGYHRSSILIKIKVSKNVSSRALTLSHPPIRKMAIQLKSTNWKQTHRTSIEFRQRITTTVIISCNAFIDIISITLCLLHNQIFITRLHMEHFLRHFLLPFFYRNPYAKVHSDAMMGHKIKKREKPTRIGWEGCKNKVCITYCTNVQWEGQSKKKVRRREYEEKKNVAKLRQRNCNNVLHYC